MHSRLDLITDWVTRADKAGYRVAALARDCGVDPKTLRRYFIINFAVPLASG